MDDAVRSTPKWCLFCWENGLSFRISVLFSYLPVPSLSSCRHHTKVDLIALSLWTHTLRQSPHCWVSRSPEMTGWFSEQDPSGSANHPIRWIPLARPCDWTKNPKVIRQKHQPSHSTRIDATDLGTLRVVQKILPRCAKCFKFSGNALRLTEITSISRVLKKRWSRLLRGLCKQWFPVSFNSQENVAQLGFASHFGVEISQRSQQILPHSHTQWSTSTQHTFLFSWLIFCMNSQTLCQLLDFSKTAPDLTHKSTRVVRAFCSVWGSDVHPRQWWKYLMVTCRWFKHRILPKFWRWICF